MITKVLDPGDVVKSDLDSDGNYDILVDMNQIGLPEDKVPPQEIHFEGLKFYRAGIVCESIGKSPTYWSYWNDDVKPVVNLQLHTSS